MTWTSTSPRLRPICFGWSITVAVAPMSGDAAVIVEMISKTANSSSTPPHDRGFEPVIHVLQLRTPRRRDPRRPRCRAGRPRPRPHRARRRRGGSRGGSGRGGGSDDGGGDPAPPAVAGPSTPSEQEGADA
jgi:hypothetical protein